MGQQMLPEGTVSRRGWAGVREELQPSTSASKSPTREKPCYWLSGVNWEVSSGKAARHVMVEIQYR